MSETETEVNELVAESITGFNGSVRNGLQVHPDGEHILYPLGCNVVVQNWKTKIQRFLIGHTDVVCAVAVSADGKYVASAQTNHIGFRATVILWEFDDLKLFTKHEIHKVCVESVVFSSDSNYLISLGGFDDATVVVWDIKESKALCGCEASRGTAGIAIVLCPANIRGVCFITGGQGTIRAWKIDRKKRQVSVLDVKLGMIRRHVICIVIDAKDEYAYCGTTTGDIMKIRLNYDRDPSVLDPTANPALVGCYAKVPKKKKMAGSDPTERYSKGVTALALLDEHTVANIIVAAGDGKVELVKEHNRAILHKHTPLRQPSEPQLVVLKGTKLDSGATTIKILKDEIIGGTEKCEIYTIDIKTFNVLLHITCHTDAIFDLAFPHKCSERYATSSKNDVRIWDAKTSKELMRITVLNLVCASIVFAPDGSTIITGWNDGIIRGFTLKTGKLMFEILNAHTKGVTAMATTACGSKLISGGGEGLIRIWEMKTSYQKLLASLREHRGAVSSISISNSNKEAVSSCTDGTCIIWDIECLTLKQVLSANSEFLCARFIPSDVQVITVGADRKICYWEVFDGSLIRTLEGSISSGLTSLDISPDGKSIVTSSSDMYIKLWKYKEGISTDIGRGHAAVITAVRFSPDGSYIVSVSADGGIFRWKCPPSRPDDDVDRESISSRMSSLSSRSQDKVTSKKAAQQNISHMKENGWSNLKSVVEKPTEHNINASDQKTRNKGVKGCSSRANQLLNKQKN
ncbi:cilia- and flagella-associated protein 52-like [Schistocerca gregaria]|uniref:cilia- and flagella-associated protein 52-like n=1 Tax=Schistocerca gregaria TaxID=7010 RepID=UPI00211DEBA6|nr:cilia- and flagella-associated protein 52-like [Schistocerca gregaria]